MSWQGLAALLLVMAALGVAALAVGALIYGSLLPQDQGPPEGGMSVLLITGFLFVALVTAAVWILRSRRERRPETLDRSLMEALLDEEKREDEDD